MIDDGAPRPGSGVMTFLFTDIEGSTRRWEADADAMRVALEAHNQVLREAVDAHGGRVFNYTGDGMCAVFWSPRSAVDAAVTAQRALELPVRMGIGTGEAELRSGEYFGTVLNRTARVMAAGHGGQILLDGATAGLLGGVDLMSLGPRRLRDIAKPVEVFQVQADGLRADFPPLKTLDATPGNLRTPTTSFIGREAELAELQAALKAHRLVTMTGVGGVGKTRLALEVAARSVDDFPDGVWIVELAAVNDPAAVPEAVAAVLGIVQQPGLNLADSVAAALEGRLRLLVFDNCEHVLDAAADMIEAIISRSSTVKVLATSREGLRLADEQLWPVPSLVHSDVDSAAALLFIERAQAVSPVVSFASLDEAGAVVEICRRLDGIPLGIELAASRMQSMTATEVRDRLDDRFRLLVGSRRGLERHQTLRHAVQWSYDLLDEPEKQLLTRCSVFAGGFDLEAALAVAGSSDEFAALDLLDALTRKSLLVTDRSSGRTRFTMLETIRQFAEEQLVQSGTADATRDAHAHYFAAQESPVMALWDSARQRDAYSWFATELANLRTAFRWAADHDDLDTAAAIACPAVFLCYWVEQYEPITWAEELIEPAKAVEHSRLAELYIAAALCHVTGRRADFIRYADAGASAIASGRFDDVPPFLEVLLGGGYMYMQDVRRGVEWGRAVIERSARGPELVGPTLVFALSLAGAHKEAKALSEELFAVSDQTVNPMSISGALLAYGHTHRAAAPATAYAAFRRGLAVAQDSGNRQMESVLALSLSSVAATHASPLEAFDYVELAIRSYYDSGTLIFVSGAMGVLVALLDRFERYEAAATISTFAEVPVARGTYPEINASLKHLREVLGDERYESLARTGMAMSNAAMAKFALEQIDDLRALLTNAVES
ncbi:putative ATPase/class 3 adenylate cyclase [Mycobacterium sp. OAS707]|uniref:ATP-binding protein n=1 Tax=Mycobacterium sp. OAS707 TaxID=2663822 RepID=UPI0019E7DA74|nr:adenylate/guanylate cyclase domain-containing protein [Mycobacterium sp. OAS707]MBE1550960.1 putative ATPase/class 3 adenylate cyclase [Mycobacterium sp. OAS707]